MSAQKLMTRSLSGLGYNRVRRANINTKFKAPQGVILDSRGLRMELERDIKAKAMLPGPVDY